MAWIHQKPQSGVPDLNTTEPRNFAITGVGGYIAPRHLEAIKQTGNHLLAALDPHDSVGILDEYFPKAHYFSQPERFDRYLETLRNGVLDDQLDYMTVCSPNHLHDAHIRMALKNDINAICEKPLVLNPWNLDMLSRLQLETGRHIYTVLQLRFHKALQLLKHQMETSPDKRKKVRLTYITPRGRWYEYSWKGDAEKSGGIMTNIGIHFFDVLLWLFGDVQQSELHLNESTKCGGFLELKHADVQWFLSVDARDLPEETARSSRYMEIDGDQIHFDDGFTDLHVDVYRDIFNGGGFGISDVRPSIELVHQLRNMNTGKGQSSIHPNVVRNAS